MCPTRALLFKVMVLAIAIAACSTEAKNDASPDTASDLAADKGMTDSASCSDGQILRYATAGCGAAAQPLCDSPFGDACFEQFCGCDGQTLAGCGNALAPWAYRGPCRDGGADATDATGQ